MKKFLVIACAAFLVAAFTLPAMAAEWSFYGSARMTSFWSDASAQVVGTDFDDTDLDWSLQGNSRIGANVKAGDITGRFEYGTGVNTRILWGEWDFGSGKLGVGQHYSPVNFFLSNQVYGGDSDMLPYGGVYGGRQQMIRLRFPQINLDIAALRPNTPGGVLPVSEAATVVVAVTAPTGAALITSAPVALPDGSSAYLKPATAGFSAVDTDTTIPKLEARINRAFGPAFFEVGAGYQSYDEVDVGTDTEYEIDSYIAYLGMKFSTGPFNLGANIFTGSNLGPYGMWETGADDPVWDSTNQQVVDNDSFGYLIVGSFKLSDMLTFEAGYGYAEHELDRVVGDATTEDDVTAYYIQAVIVPIKGVKIIPEIGEIDLQDNNEGADEGDTTYYGLQWRIDF